MVTRGVFALMTVNNETKKKILLSERQDGKGWNLPGGGVKEGESDFDALIREVNEETGLEVEVLEQIGEPLVFGEDTAIAYTAIIVGGQMIETSEAKQHRYFDKDEIRSIKIVGPEGRLGRTGRMIYDGLSLLEEPILGPNEAPEEEGVFVSDDKCFLIDETSDGQKKWPRLDPYSPTGFMEPKK